MAMVKAKANRPKGKKKNVKKSRKEERKEKRKLKKVLRNNYYTNKNKKDDKSVKNSEERNSSKVVNKPVPKGNNSAKSAAPKIKHNFSDEVIRDQQKEKRHQQCLENEMFKRRQLQLQEANEKEEENIRKLEKQLNLKSKSKKKAIPKSFAEDGLDYLLELCDSETLAQAAKTEKQLANIQNIDEFDEDIEIALGKGNNASESKDSYSSADSESDVSDIISMDGTDSEFDDEINKTRDTKSTNSLSMDTRDDELCEESDLDENDDELNDLSLRLESCVSDDDSESNDSSFDGEIAYNCLSTDLGDFPDGVFRPENLSPIMEETNRDLEKYNRKSQNNFDANPQKRKNMSSVKKKESSSADKEKRQKLASDDDKSNDSDIDQSDNSLSEGDPKAKNDKDDGTWEDIYGRKRDKKGNIIKEVSAKYIPPQARARMLSTAQSEKIQRMKRQIKGLLNKLTEQNIHSIASELEGVYMSNSRHDTNDTLTNISLEFLISDRSIPDIMMAHHAMLVSILHANVGTEVGAFYLQSVVRQFDILLGGTMSVENKQIDNAVGLLSHLYNFKVYSSPLLLEILTKLSTKLNEKNLDCVLVVLRISGFFLRKEDPSALKEAIVKLQATANNAPSDIKNNFRMKFMLDVLMAIKNNNVSKIPTYDHTQSEHLRKTVRNHYRKGNYVSTLNITLDDLLNADEQGRWWLVGSAWSGNKQNDNKNSSENKAIVSQYSQKLLELAKEQRMNTDIRRNIFCAIMSAEDYLDAFEKILHLGLKGSQEREVAHVLLSCCLQEKTYNPYYSILAQKFCDTDRKYQMSLQYSLWDKLRDLAGLTPVQSKNLAKFLIHLFVERGLPISVLKVIEFSELQKLELRLIRQILLGILLNPSEHIPREVFERVSVGPKLKLFRQGLRLFLQHFLMGDANTSSKISEEDKDLLKTRVKMVDQVLSVGELNVHF